MSSYGIAAAFPRGRSKDSHKTSQLPTSTRPFHASSNLRDLGHAARPHSKRWPPKSQHLRVVTVWHSQC